MNIEKEIPMREKRRITEAEAMKLIADEADNFPHMVINDVGKAEVTSWVQQHAKDSESHHLDAWFLVAENIANDVMDNGEYIVIEMTGRWTLSGKPVTLKIDRAGFDWQI